jgi:RimJ/RimL family protein N-acetyltransferase
MSENINNAANLTMELDIMIETTDLIIRRFTEEDWKDLYEYLSNPTVVEYEPYGVYSQGDCVVEAKRRSQDKNFFAVVLKKENKVIGNLYFSKGDFDTWEIGYVFNLSYQGNGYATQGAQALIDYAIKNCNARRIIAKCNIMNISSWKLMERLNMRREGFYKKKLFFKLDESNQPIWIDAYEYAILAEEWI